MAARDIRLIGIVILAPLLIGRMVVLVVVVVLLVVVGKVQPSAGKDVMFIPTWLGGAAHLVLNPWMLYHSVLIHAIAQSQRRGFWDTSSSKNFGKLV